jgi:hypothetical protein
MIRLLVLLLAAPLIAQAADAPIVGDITYERKNVFDPRVPGEDWHIFLWANRIHLRTREKVVRREMLIAPGDKLDPLKIVQTERNLRALGFIRHADILRERETDGRSALRVRTQDSWTLQPQLSVGTEGGDNFFVAGIREGNLLGLGKEVSLFHSQDGPTVRNEARYLDPRLLGSWSRFIGHFADTSRGSETGLRLNRRFIALDTRSAYDAVWAKINQEEVLYRNAVEDSKFDHDYRTAKGLVAKRLGAPYGFVTRASAGILYEKSRFSRTADTRTGSLPIDRTLSGPVVGLSWIQPRYMQALNVNSMQRTEDFNLGNEFSFEGGPLLESWGSDRDRWIFSARDQVGLDYGPGRFVLGSAGVRGRMANRVLENAMFFANLNLVLKTPWILEQTLIAHLEYTTTTRLDKEKQLVLGGQTGLRGFKTNSFAGDRSVLFNLEDRLFYDREFFHLVYLGGVTFFDAGWIAPGGRSLRFDDIKSNVGFGLRLSPSRSTTGGVLRMDLAYQINKGPGKGRWVASVRGGHAFSFFSSSNRRARRKPDAILVDSGASDRLLRR